MLENHFSNYMFVLWGLHSFTNELSLLGCRFWWVTTPGSTWLTYAIGTSYITPQTQELQKYARSSWIKRSDWAVRVIWSTCRKNILELNSAFWLEVRKREIFPNICANILSMARTTFNSHTFRNDQWTGVQSDKIKTKVYSPCDYWCGFKLNHDHCFFAQVKDVLVRVFWTFFSIYSYG